MAACSDVSADRFVRSQFKSIVLGFMVLVLIAGGAVLAYARWTRPITEADAELAAGQLEPALASYAVAEARFDQIAPLKQAFSSEYNRVVANQLWVLYKLGRYDDTIDKAQHAPDGAMPHFWAGLALYRKSEAEKKPDARVQLVNGAQQELYRAVEGFPEDWDSKYNFELVSRVQNSLRPRPKPAEEKTILIRPEDSKKPNKPVKPGG
jgi:tetratricopeptide (TPR) repeat protein